MAPSTTTAPESIVGALRGDRSSRPPRDIESATALRSQLEEEIAAVLGARARMAPLVIRSSSLGRVRDTAHLADTASARLRGVLVNELLRLHVVGVVVTRPFEDATAAWLSEQSNAELVAHFEQLDPEELARLATDVTAHYVTLSRAIGRFSQQWTTRTAQQASQRLGGGRVLLRDLVDLVAGSSTSEVTSVVLVDLTTAPLGENAERAVRYHALVQTLRTGVVPLRSAVFSTATGELSTRDVDGELLAEGVTDVIAAVRALATTS